VLEGLLDIIGSLEDFPLSHPIAPDFPLGEVELRGALKQTFLIYYSFFEERVHIVSVRHGAMKPPIGRE